MIVWPEDGARTSADARAVEVAGFESVSGLDTVEAARETVREDTRVALEAVRADLERAQSLYLEQDFAQMAQVLATAEERALSLLALPGTCDTLWELEFRRGLAALGAADETATRARFRLAASLRPDRRPDAAYYGPDVAQAFAEAVEAERAAVRSPFGVTVIPDDATRFVDCGPAGGETELSMGLHVVWVGAPGFSAHAAVVDVAEASTTRVALAPDPRRGAEALAALPPEVPVRVTEPSSRTVLWQLLDAEDVDALVWLEPEGTAWEAQLHVRDARGRVHREATRGEAVAAALSELSRQGTLVMVAPVVEREPGPQPEPKRPLVRKWWFWTAVGGVVLTAVAVGLAVGLGRTTSGPSRQTITVE